MRNYKLILCGIIFLFAVTLKSGCSMLCYGSLQADPVELVKVRLDLSAYNSMYLYTQPLSSSSCLQGYLIGFNFCYRTTNQMQNVTEPVFTIALLQDTDSDYIVRHIYQEMEEENFCLGYSTDEICCRLVTVGSTLSLTVNSSFVLAVITSTALIAGNRSLYETPKNSSGVVYSPPPTSLGELGSSVVGLERRAAGQIPELFISIVLKGKDEPKMNAVDTSFDKYLPIVIGGSMFLLALFTLCVAGLIFGTLTVKMKHRQKRVRHFYSPSSNFASTSNFKDALNDSTNITMVQDETCGLSVENPSEADGNLTANDAYGVAQEPKNNSSNFTMVSNETYGLSIENLPDADDNITTNEAYGVVLKPENNSTNIRVFQDETHGLSIENLPDANDNITTNEAYGVVPTPENNSTNIRVLQDETHGLSIENLPDADDDITTNEAYGVVPKPENNSTNISVFQNEAYGLFKKPPEDVNVTINDAYGIVLEPENDANITMVQNETYGLTEDNLPEVNGNFKSNEVYGVSQDLEPDYLEIP